MLDLDSAARAALARLTDRRTPVRVAVVGDVVLDQFVYGAVERISPEAPVPVVEVEREVYLLGGAANVVHNLRALGAEVTLLGVVGADSMAERIREELGALGLGSGGLVTVGDRPTALKTRVIAQHQQVVRFDREKRGPLPPAALADLVSRLEGALRESEAIIVSDYGKGVVTRPLMESLLAGARERGLAVAVDPKPVNADCYRGVDLITPNIKETEAMTGQEARGDEQAALAGRALLDRLGAGAILVTRGDRGMTLVERAGYAVHIPARARDVFDVTGAGDTTISVLALARAAGAELREAACLANLAAGLVVGKLGTAVVATEELQRAVKEGSGPVARPPRG